MFKCVPAFVLLASLAPVALADFGGQTILGPLSNGSIVNDTLVGATDDNDGWFSGGPVFGIWDGGDDVWALNWDGGHMTIDLSYDIFDGDPDLFLYTPGSYDESSRDDYGGDGFDTVSLIGAPAGLYYILIDTTAGNEGAYTLSVIPAPGSVALFGALGCTMLTRRRR